MIWHFACLKSRESSEKVVLFQELLDKANHTICRIEAVGSKEYFFMSFVWHVFPWVFVGLSAFFPPVILAISLSYPCE